MLSSEELRILAASEDFDRILDEDPVLKELYRDRIDRKAELDALFSLAREMRPVLPQDHDPSMILTPALWVFLWASENPYCDDFKKITEEDTGIFLYLLQRGRLDLSVRERKLLPVSAGEYCRKNAVKYPEAAALLMGRIRRTFKVLEILPAKEILSPEERAFDLYWMILLCSIASTESNHTLPEIMFRMPLSFVFYCFVTRLKKEDRNGVIRRRSSAETAEQIMKRVRFLGEEFCRRKEM